MTRRRWWLLAGVVAFLWVVLVAVLFLNTVRDLRDGRQAARDFRKRIDAAAIADGSALADLRQARDAFRSAARSTSNPLLLPIRALPVAGRQLRSAHALSSAARDASDAAVHALVRAHEVLRDPKGGGPARVTEIRALEEAVITAARRVRAVTDLGPRNGLIGPLASARNELVERLLDARHALEDAAAGATAGRRLLEGPRHYLLVAANNAEMRAGSGMWLSGGVLTTAGGRLELGDVEPLYYFNPPSGVPIQDTDLRDRWDESWPHPSSDWRALMVSPRLPASAALGHAMWRAAGRGPIDGILMVDPVGLAAVVRATGPVEVDGQHLTADEIVPTLLHKQYLALGSSGGQAERREALGDIAEAAFRALDAGDWSATVLARELATAVAGRHLLAWSVDPVEQRGWEAAGLGGDLTKDSLLVSVLNRGTNKLDWFLHTEGSLTTAAAGADTSVTVRLTFRNTAPSGLPRYVAGPPPGERWEPGTYVGVVAIDVPGWALDVRIDGVEKAPVQGPDGPAQVIVTELHLRAGTSREMTVRFESPGRRGELIVEPSARVPGITWHYGARTWQDSRRRAAKWDRG